MSDQTAPKVSPAAVRTPLSSPVVGSRLCPVCQKTPLPGAKTVCSAACRRERSRRREVDARRARDQEVRMLLETALRKLEEGPP